MMERNTWLVLVLAAVLSACGGGSGGGGNDNDDDDDNGGNTPDTLTGVFVDSAVAGIAYETETQQGTTNDAGEFEYQEGENVTFSIGDITLPAVAAGALITPLDVFDTQDFENQAVINLARLLQSLDDDGDPTNGITLTAAAHTAATGLELNFDVPVADFEANANVINLVSNGGGSGVLVPVSDALSHLRQLSLVGSWQVSGGDNEYVVVTFMADGTYLIAEGDAADDSGGPGVEYGGYEWNPLTGELSVTVQTDTNGEWGLSHMREDFELVREGTEFIARETIDGVVDEARFTRIESADDALVGGWIYKEEGLVILLVFNGMYYAHAEIGASEGGGMTGPEFGTYSWTAETGAFVPAPEVDHNGEWGPSSLIGIDATLTVEGNVLTVVAEDGSLTLARVK